MSAPAPIFGCEVCETFNPCEPCSDCGNMVHVGDFPFCPHPPATRRRELHTQPVTIHIAADGAIRFPGRHDAAVPKGFEKKEMTYYEARKFCRQMNDHENRRHDDYLTNLEMSDAEERKAERAELRQAMQGWGPLARDFARHAMEQADKKDAERYRRRDSGFHIEGLE